MMMMVKSVILA